MTISYSGPGKFALTCKCGEIERDLDNKLAYIRGWRMLPKGDHLCSVCAGKRAQKRRKAWEKNARQTS